MRWIIVLTVLMMCGCEKSRVYEQNRPLPKHQWSKDAPLHFEVSITDTISAYNLSANIRHSAEYQNVNLWTQLDVVMPSGDTTSWRENLLIGDNVTERWLGDCIRDICDVRVPIASGVYFPRSGKYAFQLSHLMWEDPLQDVMSVGLRLEKQATTSGK